MNAGFKILWVCPDSPFPADHGGKVDIYERLKDGINNNFIIDLVCTKKKGVKIELPEDINTKINKIIPVERDMSFKRLLSFKPFHIQSRKKLKDLNFNNAHYDLLLLESEHVFYILENKTFTYKKNAVRVHNDEVRYIFQLFLAGSNLKRKLFYFLEFLKFLLFRSYLNSSIENHFFVSSKEFNNSYWIKKTQKKFLFKTPFEVKTKFRFKREGFKVLFIGSIFMDNNLSSIYWYLENVHNRLINIPEYKFYIAGNTKGLEIKQLKKITSFKKISLIENPDNFDDLYEKCSVFINPMKRGAGLKQKTVRALEHGMPIVSTKVGVEGLDLKNEIHYINSETGREFYIAIKTIFYDPDFGFNLVKNAQNFLSKNSINLIKKVLEEN